MGVKSDPTVKSGACTLYMTVAIQQWLCVPEHSQSVQDQHVIGS
jgi:hypothetical protein